MKRIFTVLVFFLAAVSLFSASTYTDKMQRHITVQGGYGAVCEVKFDRIATQSSSFTVGMPFDIEGRLVQYEKLSKGREISYWSILKNSQFSFTINATKLTSKETYQDTDGTKKKAELDYIMTFTYTFGYTQNSQQGTKEGTFTLNTETGDYTYNDPDGMTVTKNINSDDYADTLYHFDIVPSGASSSELIGSVDGSVYFMFTAASTDRISNAASTVPSGDYSATVTLQVLTK